VSWSFFCSTEPTGTIRFVKRTLPVTPLSTNGLGWNVRRTTRLPLRETIS
jgi:hypothetical protein